MAQIKFDMTLDDVKNMDMDIDFYDIKSTTKYGIDPLPMNKTYETFQKILLQQTEIELDICNKKRELLEMLRFESNPDNALNLTEQDAITLFVKCITMESLYKLRRNEIQTVLQNLAS